MIATNYDIVGPINPNPSGDGGGWDDILGRVLGGINGARNPGDVTVGGSTPTVYVPGSGGAAPTTNYMPLILIALVVVAIVVLSK